MAFFGSMNISASALTAQRLRMDIIAQNIANAETTRTANGEPYQRRYTVLAQKQGNLFESYLSGYGVRVNEIAGDDSPFKLLYDPDHVDADENGYVRMPNVDIAREMIDMMIATRAYEANTTVLGAYKNIAMKALEIGK